MELFKIRCTTCQAKLRVQDPAAVGEIVACPKCNSMVLIDPPVDWVPPKIVPGTGSKRPIVAVTTDSSGTLSTSPSSNVDSIPRSEQPVSTESQEAAVDSEVSSDKHHSEPVEDIHLSPTEQLGRKLTLLLIVPAVALFAFTIYWTIASSRNDEITVAVTEAPAKAANDNHKGDHVQVDAGEDEVEAASASPFDVRWMPADSDFVVRVGPSVLHSSEIARVVIESQLNSFWETFGPLLKDVASANLTIDSLQCAGQTPGQWKDNSLFVVQLSNPAEDVAAWFDAGKPTQIELAGAPCRIFESWQWPYPLALVGERILITGSPEMLGVNDLGDHASQVSSGLSKLLGEESQALDPNSLAMRVVVDLSENTDPNFTWLPEWVVAQASSEEACKKLNTIPRGVDMQIGAADLPELSITLLSDNETQATSLVEAFQNVMAGLGEKWQSDIAALEQQGESGRLPAAVVEQVRGVLSQGMSVLQTAATLEDGVIVKTTFTLPGSLDNVASSFVDSQESRQRFRDLQYIETDLKNQQTILKGLTTSAGSEGYWPLGAAGAVQLPADTRLSWISSMLPYLEGDEAYQALHGQLNFFRSWNDPANLEVAKTPLQLFTNPRLGASVTAAGFPTTNYVGMGGLGADAASLDPADPRAGVFNNRHRVLLEDIKDGLSHTIAIVGVTGKLGPWAAGGDATVRPFTGQPFVGGPDHFGSGMTGGMFVGMADGSVQFIGEDVDPNVMEQLVTINGGGIPLETAALALIPASRYLEADSPVEEASTTEKGMEAVEPDEKPSIAYDAKEVEANASASAILDTELAAIDFDEATLDDFIEFMTQLTTVKISFDLAAMSDIGVGTDDTISVHLQDASYRAILDTALSPLGLGFVIRQGELVVTTLASQTSLQRVAAYSVADLCGDRAEAYEQLAQSVQSMIDPDGWSDVGGAARVEIKENALVVEANEQVHNALATYLAKLRLARGIGNDEAERSGISLVSRVSGAFEALQTPVNLKIDNPKPLGEILNRLQTSSGVNVLIDTATLDAVGVTPALETTLQAAGATLGQALERLCASLDLNFRIENGNTVLVTTPTASAGLLEVEFYPVSALLDESTSSDDLITQIKSDIAPRSWRETGGPAGMVFDEASNCLIVLQTQREQVHVESLLGELMAKQAQP